MGSSFLELYILKKKTPFFLLIAAILLILAGGFRYFVGADYPIYKNLFSGFSLYTSYQDVFDKALFRKTSEQIEWVFVLLNKLVFDAGLPFYTVTFVMILLSVSLKFTTIYQNLALPALGAFMYYMPLYFFEDSGQIRQGMAVAICVFSFRYIKTRNLKMFLLLMYLALGFHKTAIIFIPAYWIVKIPMNSNRILLVIVIAILLSPFEVYRIFGTFVDTLATQDISDGFTGYVEDSQFGQAVAFGLSDIIKIIFIYMLVVYDRPACEKIPYYEYMRNLAIFGLFLFYVFRENRIFAIRLPGAYMFFMSAFVMPSIVYAVREDVKRILHTGLMLYLFLMYFNFSRWNGVVGNFTPDRYQNILWKK
jgi:hypothetical protein